jgi:outer membrane protein
MKNLLRGGIVFALTFACSAAFAQNPVSLREAIAMALEKNPAHKAALAGQRAAAAGVRESRSALLPHLAFSETATRSNDPVYVFGTKLRQQRFTTSDFALNKLNTPTPIGDFTSRVGGQWTVFDSLQNLQQYRRAKLAQQAAQQELTRADQELAYRVVEAYYAVLLAQKEVQVAEASLKTAQSVEDRGHVRMTSGIAVEADYLTAQTQTAVRKQEFIRAQNGLALARSALALATGMPDQSVLVAAESVAEKVEPVETIAELEQRALAHRADLERVMTEQAAQQTNVASAKSAYGPRVNAFGSWQADSPSPGWNGGSNWTAGVEVQFEIFDGGARQARLAREKALADRVAAMRDVIRDRIRLEVRSAYYDLDAARQQVEVARASIAYAKESLRINQDRYESGLSTVTELLRVEEAANRAQTDYWNAVYRVRTGVARLELATGTLTQDSAVVMP